MKFEWDETKRFLNIKKHGIDFLDAALLFENQPLVKKSSFKDEDRWLASGMVSGNKITVVFTLREDRIRIISARKARKNE